MSTPNFREVVRFVCTTPFSNRRIGKLLEISPTSVHKYRCTIRDKALSVESTAVLNDEQLRAFFQPHRVACLLKRSPDWNHIHQQMQSRYQTRLQLWEEYRLINPEDAYSYSQFNARYRQFIKKVDVTMRLTHFAGECVFVDYAGKTIPWKDEKTGEVHHAQIFVGVMGCSNYTFVWASPSQKLQDWIEAHVRMFEFFGGVPDVVVPDNLKSAVTKAGLFPLLNRSYEQCIEHYNLVIDPARVRKPQDKAKAEGGVLFVTRWITVPLLRRQFFSVHEINQTIAQLLPKLNERPFKVLPGNRQSRFEELDKPQLKSLPAERYVYAEWVTEQKVPPDYHIYVKQHAYSVPYRLVSEKVQGRVTKNTVEIFHLGQRIAVHAVSDQVGAHTTNPLHRPAEHQAYASRTQEKFKQWAEHIGNAAREVVDAQFKGRPEYSLVGRKACVQLQSLCRAHGEDRFEAACQRAKDIGSQTVKSIRSILQHHIELPVTDDSKQPELPLHYNLRGSEYYLQQGGGSRD